MRSVLFSTLIILLPIFSFAQNKVALVSAYAYELSEDDSEPTAKLINFVSDNNIDQQVLNDRLPDIISKLSGFLTMNDGKHLSENYYKFVLDEFEAAPNDLDWTPGQIYSQGEKPKTDYKLTENQVTILDNYLAIGTVKPFNNEAAIKNLFSEMSDVSGLMFIEFMPSANFAGTGGFGVGDAKAAISFRIKVVNRKMKTVLNSGLLGIMGKSTTSIPVGRGEFDNALITKAFNEAIDDIISKLEGKLKKKASKIKW